MLYLIKLIEVLVGPVNPLRAQPKLGIQEVSVQFLTRQINEVLNQSIPIKSTIVLVVLMENEIIAID